MRRFTNGSVVVCVVTFEYKGAFDWCYGVIQAAPGPGYPLKRRNLYTFVITIQEWTAINLDDTTVLECVML